MSRFLFIIIFITALPFTATHAAAPVPASKKIALESMEGNLEASQGKVQDIETRAKDLKSELIQNRKALVKSSRAVHEHEAALLTLEADMERYADEYDALQVSLSQDKASIVQFILALKRMENVPVEALMIRPGATLETAQSAMVMEDVTASLMARAEAIKTDVARLDELAVKLKNKRGALKTKLAALSEERSALEGLIASKERLYANSQLDLERQQREIKQISAQARSMKDLMVALEKKRAEKKKQQSLKKKAVARIPQVFSGGSAQMPISGVVTVGFGQKDHLDAPSKGLWIEGRKAALVVAPMDGNVRYTGPFKGYGNMIIVEHGGGYHSLIAGLENINTKVGHQVSKGEPVGRLAKKTSNGAPRLYYELRRHGKVINPAKKLSAAR